MEIMIKSAVMVFSKDAVNGCWKWGEHILQKYLLIIIYALIFLTKEPGTCI